MPTDHDQILTKAFRRANRSDAICPGATVEKAWLKANSDFDARKGEFENFFGLVLSGRIMDASREQRRYHFWFMSFPDGFDFPDAAAEAAWENAIRKMDGVEPPSRRDLVARAVRRLDKLDRKLLWLAFWKDMTYPQIVRHLKCQNQDLSVSAIKNRVSRAYAQLRPLLGEVTRRG